MNNAANLQIRADLMQQIRDYIDQQSLTQAQAAQLFGVPQPRISEIVQGKVELFTVDKLINLLACIGRQVEVTLKEVESQYD